MPKLLQFTLLFFSGKTVPSCQLLIGSEEVWRVGDFPEEQPDAMISVYYEDYLSYDPVDLLAAIENATISARELYFAKLYSKTQREFPSGSVTLYPLNRWKSRELSIFEFLRTKLGPAIEAQKIRDKSVGK